MSIRENDNGDGLLLLSKECICRHSYFGSDARPDITCSIFTLKVRTTKGENQSDNFQNSVPLSKVVRPRHKWRLPRKGTIITRETLCVIMRSKTPNIQKR